MAEKNKGKSLNRKGNKSANERKKGITIGGFIVIAFLFLYIPSLLHWIYKDDVNTDIIRMGTIEDSVNAYGYIIRDESVFKSPFDGKYIPDVEEGEKIPANFRIATILKESSFPLLKELEDKDLKIVKAQSEKSENQDFFSEDIAKIENEIAKKVGLIALEVKTNSMININRYRNDIEELIHKKAMILGGIGTSDSYINMLKKEREQIQRQIDSATKDISSATPGVVSYIVDGYEEVLSLTAINGLTPETLNKITVREYGTDENNKEVKANKPFAKIIVGNEYYIAVAVNANEAQTFAAEDIVKVRLNDIGCEMNGDIIYKSEEQDRKQIIAVRVSRYMNETAHLRKVNADIIKDMHEGLMVPLKSLRDLNLDEMKASIVLVKANVASVRDVKIEGANDEFAIIRSMDGDYNKGVSLYDSYVIDPANIEEGQIINQ